MPHIPIQQVCGKKLFILTKQIVSEVRSVVLTPPTVAFKKLFIPVKI